MKIYHNCSSCKRLKTDSDNYSFCVISGEQANEVKEDCILPLKSNITTFASVMAIVFILAAITYALGLV